MKIQFKKTIMWLLGISLSSAIISDIVYGKIELAEEYLIGQFITQIFRVSMSFTFVLCLLWFMFEMFFNEIFRDMHHLRDIHHQLETKETKPIRSKK